MSSPPPGLGGSPVGNNSDERIMEDHISTLPDDVHIAILSKIAMREAARTSVLSSKWRYLWVSAFNSQLTFDGDTVIGKSYNQIEVETRKKKFVQAVDQVMQLIRYTGHTRIESFQVSFALDKKYSDYFNEWIAFVLSAGVKELHLNLFPDAIMLNNEVVKVDFHTRERYVFPFAMFAHGKGSSVESLRLQGCIFKLPMGYRGLIGLRSLYLENVVLNYRGLGDLLSGCPLLENLSVRQFRRLGGEDPQVKYMNIPSLTALRSLYLKGITIGEEDVREIFSACALLESLTLSGPCVPGKMVLKHSSVHLKYLEINTESKTPMQLVINGDNLQTLKYWGKLASISFGNVPKLVSLTLNVKDSSYGFSVSSDDCLRFLSNLPNLVSCQLEKLFLNPSVGVNLEPSLIPELSNLKQLHVRVSVQDGDLIRLAYFLEACPMLHDFRVEISQYAHYNQEPEVENMRRLPKRAHYHLKDVEFTGFKGNHKEVELALHIVCNALTLESMVVNSSCKHHCPDGLVFSVEVGGVPDLLVARRQMISELLYEEACAPVKLLFVPRDISFPGLHK